jgi:hypothetical protein
VRQQDASGVQTFEYGNMGELIKNNSLSLQKHHSMKYLDPKNDVIFKKFSGNTQYFDEFSKLHASFA